MAWSWVKKDERYKYLAPAIEKMIAGADEISEGMAAWYEQYSPFFDNETAGVSVLLAGASRKGMIPLAEYPLSKRAWEVLEKERLGKVLSKTDRENLIQGRADLWFHDGERSFSFEFKKTSERDNWGFGEKRTINDLVRMMNWAVEEVSRLDSYEYNHAMGGLISPVFDLERVDLYEEFAGYVPLSLKIESSGGPVTYFYFANKSLSLMR
ncbi:hypothetical protein [Novosphingobium profundi]|uniref:hypothetical protein n=1 Tax=Novosphingobium profundi TaxID=1774954 RepID=UPI001CFC7EA3|nr:hypothetical protein [Novosphingobium profundi]